jgi:uncharacterized repeat protein (TIGR01451 family)
VPTSVLVGVALTWCLVAASTASAAVDVSVVNEGPEGRVTTGETVTYRVVVTNNGPDVASDVSVDDRVDLLADAEGVPHGSSATSTQGSCATTGLRVRCLLGTLQVGQVETLTVRAVALSTGLVDSFATVESDQCAATISIRERNLDVTNFVSRSVLWADQTTRYTVRVLNPSQAVVRHLSVCDWLPPGFVIVGSRPDGQLIYGEYCWSVRRLAAGASKSFSVTVRAPPDANGRRTIRAIVTSLDAQDADTKRAVRVIAAP